MIGYILLIVLMIAAITMLIICNRNYLYAGAAISAILLTILIGLFMVSTVRLSIRASEGEDFKEQRDYYQELVNHVSRDMSFDTVDSIVRNARIMNARIKNNKKHADSKMWGFLYNKYIAEVEPIDIPVIEYRVFKFGKENN